MAFINLLANHTPPPPKSNLHNSSQAGATESPERGCVEDQPQQLRNTEVVDNIITRRSSCALRLVRWTQPRSVKTSARHNRREISHCSKAMLSDREQNRRSLDCSRCICVSPVHARCCA